MTGPEKVFAGVVFVLALAFLGLMLWFANDCRKAGGVPLPTKFVCLAPDAVLFR